MQDTAESKTLPAGAYIVGDPCYSISDEDWIPLLEAQGLWNKPSPRILEGEITNQHSGDPVTFTASSTAWGDGVYGDQFGRRYPVDAGLIGVVPVNLAKVEYEEGTHLVEFDSPFTVAYDEGTITIGHLKIETGDEEEDEEEYEEDDEFETEEDN